MDGVDRTLTTMRIRLNGESYQAPEGITIQGLLEQLQIHAGRVAVEVNLEVVRRACFDLHVLRDGDAVEIVNFVGGG